MPITSMGSPSTSVRLTVKVTEEIADLVEQYRQDTNAETTSAAVRELIGLGLKDNRVIDQVIRMNAEAKAFDRLSDALDGAVTKFRESMEGFNV